MSEQAPDETKLLWTGGWDSTFRLLDLVLRQHRPVQPYYVVRAERRSSVLEMNAMERIKDAIGRRSPEQRALIRDTVLIDPTTIPQDAQIKESFLRLRHASYIGRQYVSLARLARHLRLDGLELCVHVDDRLFEHLRDNVRESDGNYRVIDEPEPPEVGMFKPFRFPVLMLTKLEMQVLAAERGFADLLEMTWFCFTPDRKNRPCGVCIACGYAIKEGMARRVPWQGHVRLTAAKVMWRWRRMVTRAEDRIKRGGLRGA